MRTPHLWMRKITRKKTHKAPVITLHLYMCVCVGATYWNFPQHSKSFLLLDATKILSQFETTNEETIPIATPYITKETKKHGKMRPLVSTGSGMCNICTSRVWCTTLNLQQMNINQNLELLPWSWWKQVLPKKITLKPHRFELTRVSWRTVTYFVVWSISLVVAIDSLILFNSKFLII